MGEIKSILILQPEGGVAIMPTVAEPIPACSVWHRNRIWYLISQELIQLSETRSLKLPRGLSPSSSTEGVDGANQLSIYTSRDVLEGTTGWVYPGLSHFLQSGCPWHSHRPRSESPTGSQNRAYSLSVSPAGPASSFPLLSPNCFPERTERPFRQRQPCAHPPAMAVRPCQSR